jgi:hypothetical protein
LDRIKHELNWLSWLAILIKNISTYFDFCFPFLFKFDKTICMKLLYIYIAIVGIFISSCTKKANVTVSELNGTWKKQFSLSKNDKIVIEQDSICTWYNYHNTMRTKTFKVKYSIDKSRVYLYEDDCKRDQFEILKDRNGRLLFNVYDYMLTTGEGSAQTQTATYKKE